MNKEYNKIKYVDVSDKDNNCFYNSVFKILESIPDKEGVYYNRTKINSGSMLRKIICRSIIVQSSDNYKHFKEYLIFIKKDRKFDFKYLITLEVFLIVLVPHLIWLNNNDFITIIYGLARTGLEQSGLIDHIKFPLIFLIKQIGLLIPFLVLVWLLVKKIKFKFKNNSFLVLCSILKVKISLGIPGILLPL